MTGFLNRINTANQSTVRDTVESIKTKLSDVVFAGYMAAKEKSREV